MEEIVSYSEDELNGLAYRVLQQVAKSMSLPSNVKKIYLVQLIFAKLHKSDEEVKEIIGHVRRERLLSSNTNSKRKGRKLQHVQAMEISSTSHRESSPPINSTPKRPVDRYSPEIPELRPLRYQRSALSPKNSSDRVLRSYNVKAYKRPNYSLINNSVIDLVKAVERVERKRDTQISIISHESRPPRVNVTARCVVRRYRPPPAAPAHTAPTTAPRELTATHAQSTQTLLSVSRRRVSGIFSLRAPLPSLPEGLTRPGGPTRVGLQSIGVRTVDGRLARINAVVHRQPRSHTQYKNVEVSQVQVQDMINSNTKSYPPPLADTYGALTDYSGAQTDHSAGGAQTDYSEAQTDYGGAQTDFSGVDTDLLPPIQYYSAIQAQQTINPYEDVLPAESYLPPLPPPPAHTQAQVYHHKKIRPEQTVRTSENGLAGATGASEPPLPPPPAHLQVYHNKKVGRLPSLLPPTQPLYVHTGETDCTVFVPPHPCISTPQLEGLYTLRGASAPTPLLLMATTAATSCVYSTSTVSTAVLQENSSGGDNQALDGSSGGPLCGYSASEDVSRVSALGSHEQEMTLRKYQEAAESISSSPSLGSDLDASIEDAMELISQDGDYMERIGLEERVRCVLCAWGGVRAHLDTHTRATLTTSLTPKLGTITLYNKITGQPFSWHGPIPPLPVEMPYENDTDCLNIELSRLELLPNSANLKLLNRSLVLNSPSKVVVGQPELNDIHIIVFVKVQDV